MPADSKGFLVRQPDKPGDQVDRLLPVPKRERVAERVPLVVLPTPGCRIPASLRLRVIHADLAHVMEEGADDAALRAGVAGHGGHQLPAYVQTVGHQSTRIGPVVSGAGRCLEKVRGFKPLQQLRPAGALHPCAEKVLEFLSVFHFLHSFPSFYRFPVCSRRPPRGPGGRRKTGILCTVCSRDYSLHIFGPRKIASIEGNGAAALLSPNFNLPRMKRTSVRFKIKSWKYAVSVRAGISRTTIVPSLHPSR